ncbi:hypothetical protein M3Y94_00603500 [Aphelenchoides besseyi]|nr:hypothetical protein M3Y94_00603500 [Aphelenchoides besseyi]
MGAVSSCAPPHMQQQYLPANVQRNYIRQYQQLHRNNPCVQCDEIAVQSTCSNQWHNSQLSCPTPTINYGLSGQCGEATITCAPDQATGEPMMVVALLDNSDGRFGQNAEVYAPISSLANGRAVTKQGCTMESTWSRESMDNFRLAQPLTVQCAHQVAGYVLPPVAERYQSFEQTQQTAAPVTEAAQNVDGQVVNEDVQVVIVGTTIIPIVNERVVEHVIKEVHNYPIQKKRIIKTKHISKPTEEHREFIERVPATRIVPTFEERRATQVIRGTTLVPMVEEMEVTEMLPEVTEAPAVIEHPTYEHVVQPVAVVENSAYETVPEQTPVIHETRVEQGYGEAQPSNYEQSQPNNYGEDQSNGYEESQPSNDGEKQSNGYEQSQPTNYNEKQSNGYEQNQPSNYGQPEQNSYEPQSNQQEPVNEQSSYSLPGDVAIEPAPENNSSERHVSYQRT